MKVKLIQSDFRYSLMRWAKLIIFFELLSLLIHITLAKLQIDTNLKLYAHSLSNKQTIKTIKTSAYSANDQ